MGLMLILLEEFSIVPELWAFFDSGPEFLRFIDTFAGMVISVPTEEKMKRTLKMIHVYHLIEGAPDQKRGLREAATFYGDQDEEIMRLYRRIKAAIEAKKDKLVADASAPRNTNLLRPARSNLVARKAEKRKEES
jgi:hypothetical protein